MILASTTDDPPGSSWGGLKDTFHVRPDPSWVIWHEVNWEFPALADEHAHFLLNDTQYAPEWRLTHERSVRRVLSVEAVQRLGQIELDYDPALQHLVVHEAGLWRNGKLISYADINRFHLRQREGALENQILHGRVSAILVLEDLRQGDAIEVRYSLQSIQELQGSRLDYSFLLKRPLRTACWHTIVRMPKNAPIPRFKTSDGREAGPEVLETPDELVWVWSGREDVAQEEEQGTPSWEPQLPWAQLSGYDTWEQAGSVLAAYWHPIMTHDDGVAEVAMNMLGDSLEQRALQALRWIQEEIRYLGLESGLGGVLPATPGEVLRRRYGDCKDKSLLLTSLLRHLGVVADPVLVHTGMRRTVADQLPGLGAFNHAIVRYQIDGQYGYADPTVFASGGGLFRQSLPNYGTGLVISPENPGMTAIPGQEEGSSQWNIREDIYVSKPGDTAFFDQCIEAVGFEANLLRFRLAQVGRSGFAKAEADDLRRTLPDVAPVPDREVHIEDDRGHNRFVVASRYLFTRWQNQEVQGRNIFRCSARWLGQFLSSPGIRVRRTSFLLRHPLNVRHEMVVHANILPSPAEKHTVSNDWFHFHVEFTSRGKGEANFVFQYVSKQESVAPQECEAYVRDFNRMVDYLGCNVVVQPGGRLPVPPDEVRRPGVVSKPPPVWHPPQAIRLENRPESKPLSRYFQYSSQRSAIILACGLCGLPILALVIIILMAGNEYKPTGFETRPPPAARGASPKTESRPGQAEKPIVDPRLGMLERALKEDNYTVAATYLQQLEVDYPGHSILDLGWGFVDMGQGRYALAKERAQRVLLRMPGHPMARILEISALLYGDEWEPASVAIQAFIRDFPQMPEGWINLAILRQKQQRWGDAEKAWMHAVDADPSNPNAVLSMAWALRQKGDLQGAIEFISRCVEKVPASGPLLAIQADFLAQSGQQDKALEILDKAQKLMPGNPVLLAQRALLLQQLSRKEESLETAALALRLGPEVYDVCFFVGRVYAEAGKLDEAERLHRKCVEMKPKEAGAHNALGYTMLLQGKLPDARQCFEKSIMLAPNYSIAWENLVNVSVQTGDTVREAEARRQLMVLRGQATP